MKGDGDVQLGPIGDRVLDQMFLNFPKPKDDTDQQKRLDMMQIFYVRKTKRFPGGLFWLLLVAVVIVSLLISSGIPKVHAFDGICPVCKEQGVTSRVYEGNLSMTLISWQPYYDEAGNYHNDNPNWLVADHYCSEGHHFEVRRRSGVEEIVVKEDR